MPMLQPAYKEMVIKDISKNNHKVAVAGIIVDKNEQIITLDDGTGTLPVLLSTELPVNILVKVCGILISSDQGFQLQGHLIQDISQLNQALRKKVTSLLQ